MPVSAQRERELLNHYHLTSLYPTEWPEELEEPEDSDEDDALNGTPRRHISKLSKSSAEVASRLANFTQAAHLAIWQWICLDNMKI